VNITKKVLGGYTFLTHTVYTITGKQVLCTNFTRSYYFVFVSLVLVQ